MGDSFSTLISDFHQGSDSVAAGSVIGTEAAEEDPAESGFPVEGTEPAGRTGRRGGNIHGE